MWECLVCGLQIHAARAEDIKRAVEYWGGSHVALLSLTVRHGFGDNLRATRRGVSRSFRRMINGAPWKRFRKQFGLEHHVRALEVTHGGHGWHPHLHVLFFLDGKLTEDELREATEWLRSRWAQCVRRALGDDFLPNDHGVDLRESKRADYLAKFSLEVVDPGTKRGRGTNRTPFEIATSAASGKCPEDEQLWVAYCEGMRGAKMLTWSDGLRAAVELDVEQGDQDAADSEEQEEAQTVAVIPGKIWDAIRDRPHMSCAILEAAELAVGEAGAFTAIQDLLWGRGELKRRLPGDGLS